METAAQGALPPGYFKVMTELEAALQRWLTEHPNTTLVFRFPPEGVAVLASLGQLISVLAASDDSQALLRHLDEATRGEATVLQVQCVLEVNGMHRVASSCPDCGKLLDGFSDASGEGHSPEPGALSLCWGCSALNIFDEKLRIRRMTPEETAAIDPDQMAEIQGFRENKLGIVSIEGLDKPSLLAELYNAAKPLGLGALQYDPAPMTRDVAKGIIAESRRGERIEFDYLRGRSLKVEIGGSTLRTKLFDRDNGEGAAARIVAKLRSAQ